MSDEKYVIEITDKVAASIPTKLELIATQARNSYDAIERLKTALATINVSAIDRLSAAESKSAQAAFQAAAAQQRLQTATIATATAQARLATATQQTAVQTANATAATNRASLAALKLQQAQAKQAITTRTAGSSLATYVRSALALAGVTLSATAILRTADAFTTLQNKLQVVSTSEAQVVELTTKLFDVANRTRAPVEETATAFTRFDRALQQLGRSQTESLRLTETVNKMLIISGATGSEAAAGLLQLSQAFNKGKLDGDEFRTVMELMPSAADAIAKQMKVTRGELLLLAPQGKITAGVLADAFKAAAAEVDATFGKTIPTLGQSFTVLRNNFVEAFGEFNKATGFTAGLSTAIIAVANNLDKLGFALSIVGGLVLATFGGSLITAFLNAAKAVRAFTIALALNPVGLLVIAITSVIGYLVFFEDGMMNARKALVAIGQTIDTVIGFLRALIIFKDDAFINWGAGIAESIKSALVKALQFIEDFINKGIEAANFLRDKVGLEKWQPVDFGLIVSEGRKEFKTAGELWAESLKKGFEQQGDFFKDALTFKSKTVAGTGGSNLRGAGTPPKVGPTPAELKAIEDRRKALEKINSTLDAELSRLFMLKDAREIQGKLDQIEIQFASKHKALTEAESASIERRITLIQKSAATQVELDRIYEEAVGPLRTYNAVQTATEILLAKHAVSAQQAGIAVFKASEEYLNSVDPLRQINKELEDETKLLRMLPAERAIEQQMMQITNDLRAKGIDINAKGNESIKAGTEAIREHLIANQLDAQFQDIYNGIYGETIGKQQELYMSLQALSAARADGIISNEAYAISVNQIGVEQAKLNMLLGDATWADVQIAALESYVTNFRGVMAGISEIIGSTMQGFTDAVANSIGDAIAKGENLRETLKSVARDGVSQLISGLIKLGIQYVINAALGQTLAASAMAVQTAASVAAAAATGAAWAAPAALVSLASFGANAIPASAGIASTVALSEALALAGKASFAKGGYTGNMATNAIAGAVHGQEYVHDAATTSRVGVANLDALRSGAAQVVSNKQASGNGGGTKVAVNIQNYGTSKQFDVEQVSPEEIRIIARDEATKAVVKHTPTLVASEIQNSNSKVSKALSKSTDAGRRR